MNNIILPDDSFDFNKLHLSKPHLTTGGTHVITCSLNNEPFYIQPPKSTTKQGIIISGKKMYSDLMFTQKNQNFIQWMENLETFFQEHIFKNKDEWFDSSLELHDIEGFFSSPLKSYKSGKYYLCRANIKNHLGKSSVKLFDEEENELKLEELSSENEVNTILEIKGIRCTSSSFNIEIEIKQIMMLTPNNLFEKCLFNSNKKIEVTENKIENMTNNANDAVDEVKEDIEDTPIIEKNESIEEPFVIEENTEASVILDEPATLEETVSLEKKEDEEDVEDVYQPELEENRQPEEKKEIIQIEENKTNNDPLEEIDFSLDEINQDESIQIKKRDDVHYEMYKEAKRKAKMARDLALSSYLEAKRIKNTYMLDNIDDSDSSDLEMEEFESEEVD
tara:strand:- start:16160 stop:17335 length:1176 start_codon:yes stop_codon:yes gene_type:complete